MGLWAAMKVGGTRGFLHYWNGKPVPDEEWIEWVDRHAESVHHLLRRPLWKQRTIVENL